MIVNTHERTLSASVDEVGKLMASLSSYEDRLWPKQWWPAMKFDRPLREGAIGGHGPIRYTVEAYMSDQNIIFRFDAPHGFHGTHAYYIEPVDESRTRLRHVLEMRITGSALLSWPLIYRPLHDALIEDSLSVAEANLRQKPPTHTQWSWYVRLLRWLLSRRRIR
jgi:hypothetical protein